METETVLIDMKTKDLINFVSVVGLEAICRGDFPNIDKDTRIRVWNGMMEFAKAVEEKELIKDIERIDELFPASEYHTTRNGMKIDIK